MSRSARADARGGLRVDARRERRAIARDQRLLVAGGLAHLAHVDRRRVDGEDHVRVGAEILDDLDLDVDLRQRRVAERGVLERLRPDADDQAAVRRADGRRRKPEAAERDGVVGDGRLDEVHRGRADERGDEQVHRLGVERLRRVDLQDPAVAHHRDALAERHRLDLVVRDVDRRRAEAGVQRRELRAHADPELRVEVRERLVHEERLRLAHDRAAHRHPLALAARERGRPPVEHLLEAEHVRDLGRLAAPISALAVFRTFRP